MPPHKNVNIASTSHVYVCGSMFLFLSKDVQYYRGLNYASRRQLSRKIIDVHYA